MKSRSGRSSKKNRRQRFPWVATSAVAAAALAAPGIASAQARSAARFAGGPNESEIPGVPQGSQGDRAVHRFDIPPGPLSDVVPALEKATGLSIVMPPEDVGMLPSPGVTGVMSAEDALSTALAGTALAARFVTAERVVLELRAPGESVEVTARDLPSPKYTAPVRDIPRTVTVIPESVIQNTASDSLVEALRTIPGITLGAGEGGNPVGDRPFIRGYDSQASTFVDGMRDIGAQSREVFNLESVEVSKGPNGAFGGRGAAGGSLNLNNKVARADNFVAGSFTPGSAAYFRGTVDANVKVMDSMAFRFNAVGQDADVPGRDGVHQQHWGVAPTFSAGIGKPTRLIASYYQLDSDDVPDSGIPYNNPTFNPRTDGTPRVLQTGDGSPLDVDRRTFYGLADRDFRREHVKTGTVRAEHDFGSRLTLRNTTRYSQSDQDYIWTQPDDSQGNLYYGMLWRRVNTRVSDVETAANQTDLFGAADTGPIRHTFSAGLELSKEQGENDAYTVATGSNRCVTGAGAASGYNCTDLFDPDLDDPWAGTIARNNNPSNSEVSTRSLYAFDTLRLSRNWDANLGLRVDDYSAHFVSTRAAATGVRSEFDRDDTLVNYQLGVVFKPVVAGSIYGSYSTSSTPTGNALAQGSDTSALSSAVNANLTPEKNRATEVGVKWEAFSGRALLTAAAFRVETTNARITLQDGTVAMAGEKRVGGIELGATGRVTRAWQIFGGYTWMNSELVRNGGSGAAFGLQDGAKFPNTPEHSASVTTSYEIDSRLTAGGGVYAQSKVWGSQPNNKWVPAWVRVDASASFRLTDHFNLRMNAQNLLDEVYYDKAYPTHYASIAPGRSLRITINALY